MVTCGNEVVSLAEMAHGIAMVSGSFLIADGYSLADLDALAGLPSTIGNFGLSGFGSIPPPLLPLEAVAGVDIYETSLANIDFLSNLRTITGEGVRFVDNPLLVSVSGLSAARGLLRTILVQSNGSLRTLDGLQGIEAVSGDVDVWFNPGLQSVRLDSLSYVGGRIWLWDIPFVTELHLPALEEVEDDFLLYGPDSLTDFSGLTALRSVGGWFYASTDAQSLNGLGALEQAKALGLEFTTRITDLSGLDSLHTLGPGGLHLFENAALESTRGADALQYASRINLVDNPSLVEISFPSLVEVTEFVRVEYNSNLPTCQIDRLQEQLAANGSFPTFIVSNNGTDDPSACGPVIGP